MYIYTIFIYYENEEFLHDKVITTPAPPKKFFFKKGKVGVKLKLGAAAAKPIV